MEQLRAQVAELKGDLEATNASRDSMKATVQNVLKRIRGDGVQSDGDDVSALDREVQRLLSNLEQSAAVRNRF